MTPRKGFVAQNNMKEFDPECELHHPLLIIKAVEPGCTTELQIEHAQSGRIVRLTTTENADADRATFERAVLESFRTAWALYERR